MLRRFITVYVITVYQQNQHLSLSALSALQMQMQTKMVCFIFSPWENTNVFYLVYVPSLLQYVGTNGGMAAAVNWTGTAREHVEGQSR